MNILNFFREDFSEILGVYYEDEKIFLARLADNIETAEINFEVDLNDKTPFVEQLATKIKFFCNKRGWQISKVAFTLRDGEAATFQTDFKNVPANEISNAVKIWAVANVGKDARYTSLKFDDEIWMEALNAAIVEEYISAFDKNSMQLCALTAIPANLLNEERPLTPFNRAIFAADILRNEKPPNILSEKISAWNVKKISLTAAAIFFIALTGFSVKLFADYNLALKRAETAQARFESFDDINNLKEDFDASTAKLAALNSIIAAQGINSKNFNALVKLGKIANGKIILSKVKASDENLELEGVADSPDAVKVYLYRLKNYVSPKVKLKNSSENDGQIFFSIEIIFS